ncbi:MAG: tetratricopeptide repeat protein [Gemmatimonadetes bacterium]|uniref:Tetratricopeptide repeat protein n=1 Tax=Candidatus Kutchimonas denitrificans TaxID=3056748 RepID=A0AAE4Z4V5_9BACT|nr:tetratricopeptide repeat protein [Gemmatimonadota bacterium]NIR73568.1 tetratricopeptide repeat protein [Candidatus Kutchimonas denitrificans]NIR99527.1 tetratricopeptide repeat protein [Gemmatimonadota bacterium]NIT65147.1 tetratricopeptide repeat protein [Gemmatimonadota bacterium]NIV23680.1 tetratricopeptide repeat protein [Gemmatimonadota bacterium]
MDTMRHRIVVALLCIFSITLAARGADAQTADLGTISFPTSGADAAQPHFIRGVLLLHSFEYADAAEAFREAQRLDPDFAMAYWGEAMTYNHSLWAQQDREAALGALNRLAPTPAARRAKAPTEREGGYLAAVDILYGEGSKLERDLAYSEAMRRLRASYPEDNEAKAFYALSILGTAHDGRDHVTYMRAAAVAEEVFADNPRHPGAVHYLIHSYDDPVHAPLGLRPARAYAKIAPAASHAQHMISHIFVALGMWEEVVEANQIAARVADERRQKKGLPVDARNYHALHWLAYGYLQQGRYDEARDLLFDMEKDAAESRSGRAVHYLASMRADYLVNSRRWDGGAVEIDVRLGDLNVDVAAASALASGWALLGHGDRQEAERVLSQLHQRLEATDDGDPATYRPGVQAAHVLALELEALIQLDDGEVDRAIETLQRASEKESAMPYEYGPPPVVKPSHELLGEVLLEQGRVEEARAAFEAALARGPRRVDSLIGLARAAERLGDAKTAERTYATLVEIWQNADPSLRDVKEARRKASTG